MASCSRLLDDLLSPQSTSDFLRDYWERSPFVSRGKSDVIATLFDLGDLECLLAFHGRSGQPAFSVARQSAIAPRVITEPLRAAREAYAGGETLFIPEIHRRWPPFAAFCRDLERVLRHPVGATLVFGPPDAQGLTPHFDAASVIALQVAGSKTWRVAHPLREAPVFGDSLTEVAELPEPNVAYTLEAGDVLYVPTGFPHVAYSGEEPSLHISIYTNTFRVKDVLAKALAQAIDTNAAFRRPLRPGLLGEANTDHELALLFDDLARQLVDGFDPTSVHAALMSDLLGQMGPLPDGTDRWNSPVLSADTIVAHAPGVLAFASRNSGEAIIRYPGGQTRGPVRIFPSLAFIAAAERFRVDEIPGLDSTGQLVLVERLIAEGMLNVERFSSATVAAAPQRTAMMPFA